MDVGFLVDWGKGGGVKEGTIEKILEFKNGSEITGSRTELPPKPKENRKITKQTNTEPFTHPIHDLLSMAPAKHKLDFFPCVFLTNDFGELCKFIGEMEEI